MTLALNDELRRLVRAIDCPTKILRGERSKVTSAAAAAELAEKLIPVTRLDDDRQRGTHHPVEQPGGSGGEELASFLKTNSRRSTPHHGSRRDERHTVRASPPG